MMMVWGFHVLGRRVDNRLAEVQTVHFIPLYGSAVLVSSEDTDWRKCKDSSFYPTVGDVSAVRIQTVHFILLEGMCQQPGYRQFILSYCKGCVSSQDTDWWKCRQFMLSCCRDLQ